MLKGYGVRQKIFFIPRCINIPPVDLVEQEERKKEIRNSLAIVEDKKRFFFLNLWQKKKHRRDTPFFKKLDRTDLILPIVGDGP